MPIIIICIRSQTTVPISNGQYLSILSYIFSFSGTVPDFFSQVQISVFSFPLFNCKFIFRTSDTLSCTFSFLCTLLFIALILSLVRLLLSLLLYLTSGCPLYCTNSSFVQCETSLVLLFFFSRTLQTIITDVLNHCHLVI